VIGADGARSQVAADANLPMTGKENQAGCINIFFDADLAPLVEHRPSAIFLIFSRAALAGGIGVGALRMVRPWHEWLGVWNYDIDRPPPKLNGDEATAILRQMIGDYDTEIQVRSISTWTVNSRYATRYSNGRMFCVGDAVHRHPPNNGLGSNTSIQDSYNLAWKLAYVIKGQADAGLLDTYSDERAPVGRGIVERAMKSIDESRTLSAALGLDRAGAMDEDYLTLGGEAGQRRREQFYVALRAKNYEFNGHGTELNHLYRSGAIAPDALEPAPAEDPDLLHRFHSAFVAGARVPHVWLSLRGKEVSSLDLVGRGAFTVLTGIAGRAWALAAKRCATEIGLPVRASVIGPGEAVEDLYGDLYARCGFDESSCVLVRPDGHIAWIGTSPGDEAACAARLRAVLQQLLGLPQAARAVQPASAVH
jgi:2,4-dichlorophenol 6-monooxygenase